MNTNVSVTDPMSLVGITVNADGTVHTDATRPNRRVTNSGGSTYRTLSSLLKDNYPEDLVKTFESRFPSEVDIKLALENFFREGQSLNTKMIIISLIKTSKGFLEGLMPEEDWEKISGTVAQIIFEVKHMKVKDFIEEFKKHGIYTEAALNVFDKVIGKNYDSSDIEEILSNTKDGLEDMKYMLELGKEGGMQVDKESIKKMELALSQRDQILKRIESKL